MKQNTLKLVFSSIACFSIIGCGGGDVVSSPVAGGLTVAEKNNTNNSQNPAENNNTEDTTPQKPVILWSHGKLKANKDMLLHEDGTAFFWMADTAWDLYKKSEKEIDIYLDNRAKKKFTVIQIVAMHNYYADTKEDDKIKTQPFGKTETIYDPNEAYWKHIDYIVEKAAEKNMYIAMLPAWNSSIKYKEFKTTKGMADYGTWIAKRYKDKENIIWVIGGDTRVDGTRAGEDIDATKEIALWDAMGDAIDKVDSKHLITFHPLGKIPSKVFSKHSWLDFNMLQSGRDTIATSINAVQEAKKEGLAVVDGESLYENLGLHARGGDADRSTAYQVRNDAYSQIFAGAFGNTYGHNAIFRFQNSPKPSTCTERDWSCTPAMSWQDALDAKGATQMQYVSELMQSRPLIDRVSDQSVIQGKPNVKEGILATKGDGYAMVYSAYGKTIKVRMENVSGIQVKAWWYNPRDGKSTLIGEFGNSGIKEFTPPAGVTKDTDTHSIVRAGNDWVLVLDDITKNFDTPGKYK